MDCFELDVHTHSVSSGHYTEDTVTDMIKHASGIGLKLLGISEHGPKLPDSCGLSYFRGLALAPSKRMGISVLYGAEVNIMDAGTFHGNFEAKTDVTSQGTLDLPDDIMKQLDYCIAGMHPPCFSPKNREENTNAYIRAMKNPYIRIIAHPDDGKYPVDYDRLMEAAMDFHVLLEINNSSLSPEGYRGSVKENDKTILTLCQKYRYPVLLSSDSHGCANIGNFSYALFLIREMKFPKELILNRSTDAFFRFLQKNK